MKKLFLTILPMIHFLAIAQFEGPVIKSIEEAKKAPLDVIVLDLSDQKMVELPTEVFAFKNLQRLRLNKTYIESLPERIGELTQLKALELNHPGDPNLRFSALPESISQLSDLMYIGLIGLPNLNWDQVMTQLEGLPVNNLALMHNDFTSLPEGIGNIESLRMIWLGGNTELDPAEVFDELPFLEQVGFGGSMYASLPDNISKAENIFNLWLANNRLRSVTPLQNLPKLRSLTLNSNDLASLPDGLDRLTLSQLSLDDNPNLDFREVLTSLSTMKSLTTLSISQNELTRIPDEITAIPSLEILVLRGNPLEDEEKEKLEKQLSNVKIIY
ncbi:MAG: hypothetical protein Tsb0034_23580 [Ekhidna sp.]